MKRLLARVIATMCLFGASQRARAQDNDLSPEASIERVQACAADHDRARQLLLAERWLDARAAMRACAETPCPLAISSDCQAWLEDLNRMLPSALILIERGSNAPVPKSVELDGSPFTPTEPPAPVELLPGLHQLRLTLPDGTTMAREFLLKKAEKNHIERVLVPTPVPAAPRRAPHPIKMHRPVPAATYLLATGALAAFAGSTAWLVSALHERSDARATCSPVCDPDVRTSIDTRLLFSDLSGGAGVALSALALYSFLARPEVPRAIDPEVEVDANGFALSLRGQF